MTTAPEPVSGSKRPKREKSHFGALVWPLLSLEDGLDGQFGWVGRIHIMCLVSSGVIYDTPRGPKGARFGPREPFWGPRMSSDVPGNLCQKRAPYWPQEALLGALRCSDSPKGPDLVQTAVNWSNRVGLMIITHFDPMWGLFVVVQSL